ncbi:DUF4352 domain-containing protein [Ruminococcus sp. OA3]|uniref:DUF4352 domain-containing protein n=1 Tax=Ruminococcus sp. OA3 TaxID=2914164 RepID=UPI001F071074|nr:DUF4352 domain-containing protein [Ruminococcus sp. OA3]MCH1982885.1 DUF4352 domain-containing protein [Ruminococcus sp. OA3]
MRRKKLLLTVSLAGLLMFAAYGCSSKENADESKENTPAAEATSEADPTKAPEKEGKDDAADLKDTGDSTDAKDAPGDDSVDQTPVEEIQGEGMTDTTVPDLDSIESAPTEREYSVTGQSGAEQYTLRIDGISTTDERDSNNPSNPENVAVIDYTYKNSSSEALLVDDMSFKLVVGDTVCTPYYSGSLDSAELVDEGESCSAQIAFEVGKDFREGSLVYTDAQTQEEIQFDIKLK